MEKWELAARKFIDLCNFKDDIEAVFLTGSYASGNADEFSDIDLYIVLSDAVDWRERGNKRVDGFLIEYFANPMRQIKKYIDDGYPNMDLTEINMILSGIIIYDKNSAAENAINFCKQKLLSEFPEMDEFNIKTGLYHLWDAHDELSRAYSDKSPAFVMQYFRFIQTVFELYSKYVRSPVPGYYKLYKWLTDDGYFNRYGLAAHNDQDFIKMINQAFECEDAAAMFDMSMKIYTYSVTKMGCIDIDNFMLRGHII